jgi:signal transduction histidine kinase
VQEFIASTELPVDLQLNVAAGVVSPEGGSAIAVFRILQEVLSNIARHARASRVRIRLSVDVPPSPVLYLEVSDNGVGTTPEALYAARSYGVMGLHERAAHFGGRLNIASTPGRGTRVTLVMPLPDTERLAA